MLLNIVNGYVCHNCTDVENAKKGIDPAHPKKDSAAQSPAKTAATANNPAVILGGALAKAAAPNAAPSISANTPVPALANAAKPGAALNLTV